MQQPEKIIQYLKNNLVLDPFQNSSQFLANREIALADFDLVEAEIVDPSVQAAKLSKGLDNVRQRFWNADEAVLRKEIEEIKNSQFPFLRLEASHLLSALEARNELLRMSHELGDNFLAIQLGQMAVESLFNRNKRRNFILQQIRPGQTTDYYANLALLKSTINYIQLHMNGVWQLEREFLEEVSSFRPGKEVEGCASDFYLLLASAGVSIPVTPFFLFFGESSFWYILTW